jgi:hypothetical protein
MTSIPPSQPNITFLANVGRKPSENVANAEVKFGLSQETQGDIIDFSRLKRQKEQGAETLEAEPKKELDPKTEWYAAGGKKVLAGFGLGCVTLALRLGALAAVSCPPLAAGLAIASLGTGLASSISGLWGLVDCVGGFFASDKPKSEEGYK